MSVSPGGPLLFILSAGLLLGTTLLVARRLARNPTEFFWLFPACLSLQLGLLACGLSLGRWMTPRWWLTGQASLFVMAFLWSRRRGRPEPLNVVESLRGWWVSAPPLARGASTIALLFVVLSGIRQAVEPISGFDDRMYHASRVAYWMQNASVLPYPTHNERQVAFPFGSELYFLWPVLLTKSEAVGRLAFWLGYPVAAVGVHLLAGKAGAREPYRSLTTLLFVSTPIVNSLSIGLAPELWLTVFEAGTAFWIFEVVGTDRPEKTARAAFWVGVFLLLALNVKTTAVGLALVAALLLLVSLRRTTAWLVPRALAAGGLVGLLLSGMALNAVGNVARCGNPFASAGLRHIVRSDLNARQLVIHGARLPFVLFELPWVPDPLRGRLETLGETAAVTLGATRTISFEDSPWPWPGKFSFHLLPTATHYSLGGLLWLPALGCAVISVLQGLRTSGRDIWKTGLFISTAIACASLLPVAFGLRWMVGSAVPIRFLIASWALGAVLLAVLASQGAAEPRSRTVLSVILVGFQAVPSLQGDSKAVWHAIQTPTPNILLDEPFSDVLQKVPPGSCVILFAHQDTRDYPLFRPRDGFPNRVMAWANDTPTQDRVARLLQVSQATHVLFVSDEWISRHWDPPLPVAEAIATLAASPGVRSVPTEPPSMRLFEVIRNDGKADASLPE